MKMRLFGVSLLAAAFCLTTSSALGFGGKRSGGCDTGMSGGCAPCTSYTVTWVEKKVTAYKIEWEPKEVKVKVCEWVPHKEEYKHWVLEPETKKEKVKVKEMKWKDEPHKYWVNEWKTEKEKVKVAEHKPVMKEVEVVHVTCEPVVTKQKKTVCTWVCVPVTVACVSTPSCDDRGGLFGRLCGKKKDCNEPCAAPCPQVTYKTVMQKQMVTKEIWVDVTTYNRVEKKEMKKVQTWETNWVEKEVEVRKCVAVEKTGTKKVCYWEDVEKEVEVKSWKKVEKTGTRDVLKPMEVEKTVKQMVAKHVAYETTVKVPVCTPCPAPVVAPCPAPAPSCGMSGDCGSGGRGGLFRGRRGGCCN